MSSFSPSLLVVGLISCTVGGVLAVRATKWIFNRFPKTFSPAVPTAHTPVAQETQQEGDGSKQ
ncbi:MAG: hypothetical protein ABL983_02090 [Nitrospira sp.]